MGRDIVEGCTKSTPVEKVTYAPQDAILGNERAARLPTKEGVNGSMVIKEEVKGEITPMGGKGKGLESSKEFGCLLGKHPGGTREEANAHVRFPDSHKDGAPW